MSNRNSIIVALLFLLLLAALGLSVMLFAAHRGMGAL
jgi:hypothetical protein